MKYAMTFVVDIYDYDSETGEQIITRPSDWVQMKRELEEPLAEIGDESLRDVLSNYAIAWFALKRLGKLEKYGIGTELDGTSTLFEMTKRLSVFVDRMAEPDSLPLTETAQ